MRNKKTGDIWEFDSISMKLLDTTMEKLKARGWSGSCFANSIAELNEEWEDYKTKEPLIKDEEIREIIRAWAKVNDATELSYDVHENSLTDIYRNTISFNYGLVGLKDGHSYTIEELCGTPPEPIEPKFIDLDERVKEKEEE